MIQTAAVAVGRHIPRRITWRTFSILNAYTNAKSSDRIRCMRGRYRAAKGTRDFGNSAPITYSVHLISTLNPVRIRPEDYLDLSRRKRFTIQFPQSLAETGGTIRYRYQKAKDLAKTEVAPFPPQSTGFLYYHRPPDAAPLEGSIRLRVTPDNLPSSFPLGHDLALPSGVPWQLLLLQLATPKTLHDRFCDQLLYEKLVSPDQLAKCRALAHTRLFPSLTLFRLGQPFPVNFESYIVLAVVDDKLHNLEFRNIFSGIMYSAIHGLDPLPRVSNPPPAQNTRAVAWSTYGFWRLPNRFYQSIPTFAL